jgi:hypothetical protein
MQIPNLEITRQVYAEFKFWGPVVTFLWCVFRGYQWVRDIKDNHLTHIQKGIENFNTKLDTSIESQTKDIVSATESNTTEVKELRGDIKMLTHAILSKNQ